MQRAQTTSTAERVDRKASALLNDQRDTWPIRVVGALSEVADQPPMRALCVATVALGLFRRDGHLARTGIRMLAAHTFATWGKSGAKVLIDRTRPESGDDPRLRVGHSHAHEQSSFPSGHSSGVVAVAQVIARSYPEQATVARTVALSMSTIQVPRGAHYVGDVIAGILIGVAAERASNTVIYPVRPRNQFALAR